MENEMKKPSPSNGKLEGVRSVKDIVRPRSWCIYGRSGSGKTTLSSTFPSPILLLDVRDRGTDSISDQKVDVKDIESLDDLEDTYYYLEKNPQAYKTVVIDTITQLQQVFMEEITRGGRKGNGGRSTGDWGSMTRRQFGDVAAMMKEWVLNFRNLTDLGMEIVFIAQERTSSVEDDGRLDDNMIVPEVGPAVMPSIAVHLNANVSVIGNTFIRIKRTKIKRGNKTTEKEDAQYCLRVGPNPVYATKLRKPRGIAAPAFIEDPVYEDITDVMKGE
jgi:AAA domain-containing protein